MADSLEDNGRVGTIDPRFFLWELYRKTIKFDKGYLECRIWDFTIHINEFLRTPRRNLRTFQGAIFIFDVTDPSSLEYWDLWFLRIREGYGNVPIWVMGNKVDRIEERKITKENALQIVGKHNIIDYFDVSAKDNINLNMAFNSIIESVKENAEPFEPSGQKLSSNHKI